MSKLIIVLLAVTGVVVVAIVLSVVVNSGSSGNAEQQIAVVNTEHDSPSLLPKHENTRARAADKTSLDSLHVGYAAKEARRLGIGELRFYGRVVDQDDKPVDKANVRADVTLVKTVAHVPRQHVLVTDANGYFHFDGFLGTAISIREIEKPGYIMGPRTPGISRMSFVVGGPKRNHRPDPENPVVFRIAKEPDALEPILLVDRHVAVDKENLGATYTHDVLTGKTSEASDAVGDFRVTFQRSIVELKQRTYDWSLTLSVVDGGLQEIVSTNNGRWSAPKDQYEPQWKWAFKADDPNWVDRVSKYIFFRSRNGQVHGRLAIEIAPTYGAKSRSVVIMKGLVNPNRSRRLYPGDENVFEDMEELRKFKALPKPDIDAEMRAAQEAAVQAAARQKVAGPRKEKRPAPGFFGKIVDQEGQAVVGANVRFLWLLRDPETGHPVEFEAGATTDPDGRFHFDNASLRTRLYVRAMSKDGYLAHPKITDPERVYYTVHFGAHHTRPLGLSADTPWIFHMWKQTEPPVPLIVARQQIRCDAYGEWALADLHDPSGGLALAQLFQREPSGANVAEETADLRLRVVRSKQDMLGMNHDWEFSVEGIDGGIVEARRDYPFKYAAPENGYRPKLSWSFKRNDPDFAGTADKHIYFRSDDGKTFAYVNLYVEPIWPFAGEGAPNDSALIRLSYRLNPTGSRNLLPDRKRSVESLADYPYKNDDD